MRQSIPMMLKCDGLAMLEGWKESAGAGLEYDITARLRGIPIQSIDTWIADAREARQRRTA